MNILFKIHLPLLLLSSFVYQSSCCQVSVYDDFEAPKLGKLWASDRFAPGTVEIQSAITRKGHGAVRISLKAGDVFEKGLGTNHDSERDELREATELVSKEGLLYEYAFSMYLPEDFVIVPTRLVIAQWKQFCPEGAACSDDSPVMALRYESGKLRITLQTDSGQDTLFQTNGELRGKWLDFKFRIRFSRGDNGKIEGWMGEKQVVNYRGITGYSEKRGYAAQSRFYFKMGLYRDVMPEPMSIYIDEYSKKQVVE